MMPERNRSIDSEAKKRDELILQYAPFIKHIAHRLALRLPPHISIEDIVNSGVLGLMDAVDKYDKNKGVLFKTYAEFRIKGAILDNLRSLDWVPRSVRKTATILENTYLELEKKFNRPATDEEVADALNINIEKFHEIIAQTRGITLLSLEMLSSYNDARLKLRDCLTDKEARNPLSVFRMEEIRDVVSDAINCLPDKERLVVSLYYYDDLTMNEISQTLELTESRVSQIHAKAILRLRAKLRNNLKEQ